MNSRANTYRSRLSIACRNGWENIQYIMVEGSMEGHTVVDIKNDSGLLFTFKQVNGKVPKYHSPLTLPV